MSEIMPISHQFKDTLDDIIDSFDEGFDTKTSAKLRQIYLSSNDILGPEESKKDLYKERNFLKNRS